MQFTNLPGFRDFPPDACLQRNFLFNIWKKAARRFAFSEYDAPVLESLELFVEKSGPEIVEQLFAFEDRGGRQVALRPEMTPTLARMIGARANALKRPTRWFSIGEQFRYERPQKGRLRAFYQFNADIFGIAEPTADAELIALLVDALVSLGLGPEDFKVRLSDRTLWSFLLEATGVAPVTVPAVLGVIDKMGRMPREKVVAALAAHLEAPEGWLSEIESLIDTTDSPVKLRENFGALAARVDPANAEKLAARLAEWEILLSELDALGCADFVKIDFSIVRGLAYYTGFVFEAFETSGETRALAGGGRYDDLVGKLGGPAMPATGFAMGDVTVLEVLSAKGRLPAIIEKPDCGIVVAPGRDRMDALATATFLRRHGVIVETPLRGQSVAKQLKTLDQKGARFALIFENNESDSETFVRLRELATREEKAMNKANAFSTIIQHLHH